LQRAVIGPVQHMVRMDERCRSQCRTSRSRELWAVCRLSGASTNQMTSLCAAAWRVHGCGVTIRRSGSCR